jgi:UDP-2,3-diacylglucosamine pyrophosphatase LpxH
MKIFVLLLPIALVIGLLTQLPVVTGKDIGKSAEMIEETELIELSGKTLFISDLHLVSDIPIEEQFDLDFSDAQNVVIVGDFFDTNEHFEMYGDTEEERLRAVLSEVVPESFAGKIFFIRGKSHDPLLATVSKLSFETYEFFYIAEYGVFNIDGTRVVALHGHQLYGGYTGGGLSWAAQKLRYVLPLERLARTRLGIDKDTWLVVGHSHVPAIHKGSKTANTGSFVGAPFNSIVFRVHVGTGVLFHGGETELVKFENLTLKNLYPFAL